MFTKNMKAGYQGRRDAMREKAERLMNHPGHAEAVYFSKSAADREHMRPYKEGGHIKERKAVQKNIEHFKDEMERHKQHEHHKKMEHMKNNERGHMKKEKKDCYKSGGSTKKTKDCVQKFAMGGVAKIRHEEATKDGMPTKPKKSNVKSIM
jgi:hypothetical protein